MCQNHYIAYVCIFIFCNACGYDGFVDLRWLTIEYIFFLDLDLHPQVLLHAQYKVTLPLPSQCVMWTR
jgi:hypothetical protein